MSQMSPTQQQREKLIYLRQWVGSKVSITLINGAEQSGFLTNIVFDGTRLMYILLDDAICLNYDHIIEVKLINK